MPSLASAWGLSPRVRGNPVSLPLHAAGERSIPACAGEPGAVAAGPGDRAVYPRVCGGTYGLWGICPGQGGLSPRVRGNRARRSAGLANGGSIPACAGEPATKSPPPEGEGVYPRVCGGTSESVAATAVLKGLSPRVRGNPYRHRGAAIRARSIPACAGEPRPASPKHPRLKVYPRVCGGTISPSSQRDRVFGLSPRVRGNPMN